MFLVITKSVRILYAGNISAYTSQSIFPPTPYPLVFPLIRYHPLRLRPCRYPCHQCKKCRRDTLKPLTMFHHHDLSSLKPVWESIWCNLGRWIDLQNWPKLDQPEGLVKGCSEFGQFSGPIWNWPDSLGGWPRVNVCPHILLFLLFTSFYMIVWAAFSYRSFTSFVLLLLW